MGVSSLQQSFLGGEWSPFSQGRAADPRYKEAMNVCRNTIPVEEGAALRRSGFRRIAYTRNGLPGTLRGFHFDRAQPYNIEFTDEHLRFVSGDGLVKTPEIYAVAGISSATPAVVELVEAHDFDTGDQVEFILSNTDPNPDLAPLLRRQFLIGSAGGSSFTLFDPITGDGFDGSTISLGASELLVARVLDLESPYTDDLWPTVRLVQAEQVALLLQGTVQPRILEATSIPSDTNTFATFELSTTDFLDGPYLDPPTNGAMITSSGTTAIVSLTLSYPAYSAAVAYSIDKVVDSGGNLYRSRVNNNINHTPPNATYWELLGQTPDGFYASDVGRLLRVFDEPLAWDVGTAYAVGDTVKYEDAYYSAIATSTGVQPNLDVTKWAVDTTAARWVWLQITAYTNQFVVDAQVRGSDFLYTGNSAITWRKGVYSETTGWPTCGCYHGGRLWLSGVVANRFDTSKSNDLFNFSPTGEDGTVADNNAISYTLQSTGSNPIYWLAPGRGGVTLGTPEGEWFVSSSTQNFPLTPTSITADRVTNYGCANIEPVQAGLSLAITQRFQRKILEYLPDASSGRFAGLNISREAKHLTKEGVEEIAYQAELAPVIWARMGDGSLAGISYKRESPFASQPADFYGWHRHDHGAEWTFTSLQSGPTPNGLLDSITVITYDDIHELYNLEILSTLFDEETPLTHGFFVDSGVVPAASEYVTLSGSLYIRLKGLEFFNGLVVDVQGGGLDAGSYTVTNGQIDVSVDVTGSLFTSDYLEELTESGSDYGGLGATITKSTQNGPSPVLSSYFYYDTGSTTINTASLVVDQENNRVFFYGVAAGRYNLTTGVQQLAANNGWSGPPWTLGPGGTVISAAGATNQRIVRKYDADNNLLASFGTGGATATTTATGLAKPRDFVWVTSGDDYLISLSENPVSAGTKCEVAYINLTTMAWTGANGELLEANGHICLGREMSYGDYDYADAFAIGHPSYAAPSTGSVRLYRIVISSDGRAVYPISSAISPSAIDATWTNISAVGGIIRDETDGGLIVAYTTTDAVAVQKRLVKYTADGAATVIWNTAVTTIPTNMSFRSRARRKRFAWASGSNYYSINTETGVVTTTAITASISADLTNGQYIDGGIGRLINYGTVVEGPEWFSFPLTDLPDEIFFAPLAVGFSYTSQGQVLRAIDPNDAGTPQGPALAKTRREHQFGVLVHRTVTTIKFGTDFDHLRSAQFGLQSAAAGGRRLTALELKSGIHWNTLDDDYGFDSMFCWQQDRPVPATILALGNFLDGADR